MIAEKQEVALGWGERDTPVVSAAAVGGWRSNDKPLADAMAKVGAVGDGGYDGWGPNDQPVTTKSAAQEESPAIVAARSMLRDYRSIYGENIPEQKEPHFTAALAALRQANSGDDDGTVSWAESIAPKVPKFKGGFFGDYPAQPFSENISEAIVLDAANLAQGSDAPTRLIRGIGKRIPFVGGALRVQEALNAAVSAKLADDPKLDQRMRSELLSNVARSINEMDAEEKRGFFAQVLDATSEMPAFMVELAMTGGLAGGAKKITTEAVEKAVGKTVAGRVTAKVAGGMAQAGVQAALNPQMIAQNAMQRYATRYGLDVDEQGQVAGILEQGSPESFVSALAKGGIDTAIMFGTLHASGPAAKALGKGVNKIPLPAQAQAIKAAIVNRWLSQPGGTIGGLKKALETGGWSGVGQMMLANRMAELGRAGVLGDDLPDYASKDFAKQLGVEAISLALPAVGMKLASLPDNPSRVQFEKAGGAKGTSAPERQAAVAAARREQQSQPKAREQPSVPEEQAVGETGKPTDPFHQRVVDAVAAIPAWKDAEVVSDPAKKSATIRLPSGQEATVYFDADVEVARIAGLKGKKARGAYVYKPGAKGKGSRIYLRGDAGPETLNHEAVHWLQDIGIITPEEIASRGGHEAFAKEYGKWAVSDRQQPQTVFGKIWDFLEKLLGTKEARKTAVFKSVEERTAGVEQKPLEAVEDAGRVSTTVAGVSARRAERGEEPVPPKPPETVEEWHAEAKRQMESDPTVGPRLVAELLEAPRDISKVEVQVLKRHAAQKEARLRATSDALTEAAKSGDKEAIEKAQAEADAALVEVHDADKAARVKGTLWAQSGVSQQDAKANDFSLGRQLTELNIAKGGKPLTPEEHAAVAEYTKTIERLTAELAEAQKNSRAAELETAHGKVVKDVAESAKRGPDANIKEFAARNNLDYHAFMSAAEEVHQGMKEEVNIRRSAKADAHKMTGISGLDRFNIENRGKDYTYHGDDATGRKLADFDVKAERVVEMYPDVFDSDARRDPSRAVWDLLAEKPIKELRLDDPRVLREAAEMSAGGFSLEISEPEKSPRREASAKRTAARKKVEATWIELLDAIKTTTSAGIPVKVLEAAVKHAKAQIELGVVTFTEFMSQVKKRMGEAAEANRPLFVAAWKQIKEAGELPERDVDIKDSESVGRLAKQLHREVVELGITDRESAVKAIHEELQMHVEGITRQQAEDAMSGRGEYRQLNKDEILAKVREHKGELRELGNLRDYEAGRAAPKTGFERQKPSDFERQTRQKVNEAKKKGGFVVTDPAKQLKTALDSAKAAVRNRIADLKKEIAAREKIVKERKPLSPDKELESLRKQRDELVAEHQKIFPTKAQQIAADKALDAKLLAEWESEGGSPEPPKAKKQLTEAQRIKAAENLLDKIIAQMESDLKEGKIGRKPILPRRSTPAIEAKRARLTALRAQRDELRANDPAYQADVEARNTATYKRNLAKRLADYQDRVARGDFAKKPLAERTLDKQDVETKYQIEQAKGKLRDMKEKARKANMNLGQRLGEGLNETTSLLPRTVMAGLEMSVVLRQGVFYTFAHFIKATRNLVNSLHAVVNERIAFAARENLNERDNAKSGDYQRGKVQFTEHSGPLSVVEEMYQSAIIRWLAETKSPWLLPGRIVAKSYMATERGFRTFANGMKADLFDIFKRDTENIRDFFARHGGKAKPWTAEDAKIAGRSANIFSGRGTGLIGRSWADQLWFAQRWVWSRIQAEFILPLQIATPRFIGQWNADPAMRIAHAKLYVQAMAGMATYMTLKYWLYYALADDEKHKPKIELDPRSSDFLKQRTGNTRIDTLGGMQQPAVLAARLLTGKTKTAAGKIKSISGGDVAYGQDDAADALARFIRSKLGPAPSGIVDWFAGRNVVGEPKTKLQIVRDRLIPMTWADIYQAEKELGLKQGTVAAAEAFLGASVNTYQPKPTKPLRKAKLYH